MNAGSRTPGNWNTRPRYLVRIPVRTALIFLLVAARTAIAAPHDFTPDARALFDTATCAEHNDANAAHCKQLDASIASWRAKWLDKAAPFFATLHGGAYPKTVVYPFGGGDLITLLAVYPDATEYTTLSLDKELVQFRN